MTEIISAVRSAVGSDFPVWIKIDSREVDKPGGITIDDAIATARLAEAAGVDAITVSAYHAIDRGKRDAGSHTPQIPAVNLPYAKRIPAATVIPVISSGRLKPEVGGPAIATGKADFIAMGRKLLADPSLPSKLEAGHAADILPCIYCYTRSEEHTSELQSLMRISYAVFCLKQKNIGSKIHLHRAMTQARITSRHMWVTP